VPTGFSLIALEQLAPCCRTEKVVRRIQLGKDMLRDRACPQGGWNAGNGIVFGRPLAPHIDTTAIGLLALTDGNDATALRALDWLRQASMDCFSAYSLAWSAIAFTVLRDRALDDCIASLIRAVYSTDAIPTETLSLAAIVLK